MCMSPIVQSDVDEAAAKVIPLDGVAPDGAARRAPSGTDAFTAMTSQLADSYHLLEHRVAQLNQELTHLSDRRLQELAEKEKLANRLENLLNFLPGAVIVLDSKGVVADANPAAYALLDEPLKGELWRNVIARSFSPRKGDGHEVSLKDGRLVGIQTRNLGADGQIILLTDQTETRRLQDKLSRHERLSALGKMMGALAHQIRTPLSSAMLYAGHLCSGKLDDSRRQEFSDKVFGRLQNIERQIQDMLLYVKGELRLDDEITVQALHNDLLDAIETVLITSGSVCEWNNQCPTEWIRCNRAALVGALMNLVNNAIQAVEKGAQLRIEFDVYPDALGRQGIIPPELANEPRQLWIRVIDQGPGIPEEVMSTIGDLFITTKAQGTGLGLSVVKSVARAHQGRFLIQSSVGQGTVASVLLPLAAHEGVET